MTISKDDEREAREWLGRAAIGFYETDKRHRATILALLDAPRLRSSFKPADTTHGATTMNDLVGRLEDRLSSLDRELYGDEARLLADAIDRIEALEAALRDARSGLQYIRTRYGALEGVGWDRVLPPGGDND